MEKVIKFYSLGALAEQTGLSKDYLRDLAENRKIPSLRVGGRLRFNPLAVQEALDHLAQEGGRDER